MGVAYVLWVFASISGYHTASVTVCKLLVLSIVMDIICLVFVQVCTSLKTEMSL